MPPDPPDAQRGAFSKLAHALLRIPFLPCSVPLALLQGTLVCTAFKDRKQPCKTDPLFLRLAFCVFNDPHIEYWAETQMKKRSVLGKMFNRRLCVYREYVRTLLFLYFRCSKLINTNNYHVIFTVYFQNVLVRLPLVEMPHRSS